MYSLYLASGTKKIVTTTEKHEIKCFNVKSAPFESAIHSYFSNRSEVLISILLHTHAYTQVSVFIHICENKWLHKHTIGSIDVIILPFQNNEINERFPFYMEKMTAAAKKSYSNTAITIQ